MNDAEKEEITFGLKTTKLIVAAIVPWVSEYVNVVIDAAIETVNSVDDDPLKTLKESREDLRTKIADAMKAKFPNG